jgi:hypothetical protein
MATNDVPFEDGSTDDVEYESTSSLNQIPDELRNLAVGERVRVNAGVEDTSASVPFSVEHAGDRHVQLRRGGGTYDVCVRSERGEEYARIIPPNANMAELIFRLEVLHNYAELDGEYVNQRANCLRSYADRNPLETLEQPVTDYHRLADEIENGLRELHREQVRMVNEAVKNSYSGCLENKLRLHPPMGKFPEKE